jgi:predicted AAA+ superfamily ATPase
VDNAFILTVSKKITKDKGWLLENLVFNSLNKEQDIFYYKETNECDFVLAKNKEITQAIQVCYELNVDNKRREIDGLCEALEKFKLQKGLILTYDYETELKIKNKQIIIMPVWKWLLVSSTENKVI